MKTNATLADVLRAFAEQELSLEQAQDLIRGMQVEMVGSFARLDTSRSVRCGIPEVVLAEGKDTFQLTTIVIRLAQRVGRCLVTRLHASLVGYIEIECRKKGLKVNYNADAETLVVSDGTPPPAGRGTVGIITAGTSDIRVAEEARMVAREMGCTVKTAYDVGAAGIHRLFPALAALSDADVIVVAAGREGTLPAVVAGLVDRPVIGVPVSTGYGFAGKGEAALASMLQSCAVIAVVNIDAGFTAGAFAAQIARMVGHDE